MVDARTGTPLPGVVVSVQDSKASTVTNTAGAFTIENVAAGRRTLVVSLVGYGLARPVVDVRSNVTVTVSIPLAGGTAAYTDRVTVTGDRFRGPDAAVASQQVATSAEVQDLRGVLTDDPLRAIQALPGVATGDDFRSEFSVRGSDFRHMGLSLDGVATPWLVHSVRNYEDSGSVALINGDIVDNMTLEAGAYPQVRPGRTGASLDFGIRDGSRTATGIRGAVSATSASVVAEGPIGGARRGSWLISVRQSYVQWLLKRLNYSGTTFAFADVQSKVVFDVTPRQQVQFTLVAGRSELDQTGSDSGDLAVGIDQTAVAMLIWRSTLTTSAVLTQRVAVTGNLFHGDLSSSTDPAANGSLAHGSASEFSYNPEASWTLHSSFLAKAGAYIQSEREAESSVQVSDTVRGPYTATANIDASGRAWTSSGYGQLTWTTKGGASVDGGVRVAQSTLTHDTASTPWLLGVLPVGHQMSVRAGASLASQVPDIDQVVGTYGRASVQNEAARDVDAGVEYRPSPSIRLQATVYDREEHNVLRLEDSETRVVNNTLVFAASLAPFWSNALAGTSRGVEFVIQRRAETGLTGWIGYAYGRTRYTDASRQETFWGDFDQRHTLNVYGEDRLSSQTSLSAKLRIGSNFPIPGYFDGSATTLLAGSARNTVRLPLYARLDLRANHTFMFTRRRLTLFVEVVNVFNRANYIAARGEIYPNRRASDVLSQLFPILPSAGLVIEF